MTHPIVKQRTAEIEELAKTLRSWYKQMTFYESFRVAAAIYQSLNNK